MVLIGIVALILAVIVSVALHEIGHLVPAKLFGVKVTQYMVGFGPTLFSRKFRETEYGVKALPLGGYVKMVGMFAPATKPSKGPFAALIQAARDESEADIKTVEDRNKAFYKLTSPKKLVVMLSGPTTNLLIALILFTVALSGVGTPQPNNQVQTVVECLPTETDPEGSCAGRNSTRSPAAEAGIEPGDKIISLAGTQIKSWENLSDAIRSSGGKTDMVIDRAGTQIPLTVNITTAEGSANTTGQGFLGVSPKMVMEKTPVWKVPAKVMQIGAASVTALATFPAQMVKLTTSTFTDTPRDPNGPVGVVGVSRISGQVVSADIPGSWKVSQFLLIVASLNLFLFLFNLIPVLPLDGGHAAAATFEGARRQWARLRKKEDPGPVDTARLLPVTYAVAGLFLIMTFVVLLADIIKPINL